jgi:prevent-host-death family protein
MKDITATEAARKFSDLLDAVEHRNESFVVRRGGKPIAHIRPASASTGLVVKELLRRFPPDKKWEADLIEVRAQLTSEDQRLSD